MAACFVRARSGLEAFVQEGVWTLESGAAPALLSGSSQTTPRQDVREIVHRDGTRIQVTQVPGVGVSISVRLAAGEEGIAKLKKLKVSGHSVSEEELDSRRVVSGQGHFSDCPSGLLEILLPNGHSFVVSVSHDPGESSGN